MKHLLFVFFVSTLQVISTQNRSSVFLPGNTGIRIRLNEPLFTEASQIFHSLFAYKVQTVQIPQQQQCFPEGCFSLFNFRVTGFRQPRAIGLKPLSPNILHIGIMNFDLDIVGSISGNLQIVIAVPLQGGIVITAKSISISAVMDLQKNQYRQPYLRVSGCELRGGYYDTRVTDLGLLTESINLRYKQEMISKAREVIQSTICSNLESIVKAQVNSRLGEIPAAIGVGRILEFLDDEAPIRVKTMHVHQDTPEVQYIPVPIAQQYNSQPVRYYPQQHFQQQQQQQLPFFFNLFQQRRKRESRKTVHRRGVASITEITHSAKKKTEDEDYDLWGHSESDDSNTSHQPRNKQKETPSSLGPPSKSEQFPQPPPQISRSVVQLPPRHGSGAPVNPQPPAVVTSAASVAAAAPLTPSFSKLIKLLNVDDLNKLFVDLDFVDSVAGNDFFSVGVSGRGFVKGGRNEVFIADSEVPDKKLRFPARVVRRNLDLVLNDYTPNSLLSQAHKTKLLKIVINAKTPTFGKLLRTTCSLDEICLSDSIPEASELYPNRQFEALIETVRPPRVVIKKGVLEISLVGLSTFYLADSRQTVGKIPFSTTAEIGIQTRGTLLQVHLRLKELRILEDLDFFDLPAESLNGFRDGIKGTVENLARQLLANGVDLSMFSRMLSNYGLSHFNIELLDEGLVLIQSDVDVFKLAFDGNEEQPGGPFQGLQAASGGGRRRK